MAIRYVTVSLGTKRAGSNQYEAATVKHGATQANDVTIAWDDSVVTNRDALIQGIRLAQNLALGTLPA